jgi:hypothetical protein
MWEMYTGQRAYGGLGRDAIIDRVYKKKARPVFPLGVPPSYAALARSCWDNDQNLRPSFMVVLARLTEMLTTFQSAVNSQTAVTVTSLPGATGGTPLMGH